MASPHLSNDEFLAKLGSLFESRRASGHGSVILTQKRLTPTELSKSTTDSPQPTSASFADLNPPHALPVLIRATNGKSNDGRSQKIKISTVVSPDDLGQFFVRYAEIWKADTPGLKKRDRSGRKAKAKGKKKKGKESAPPADGESKKS